MPSAIKKELAYRRIAGELFIVDAAGSRLHELNGTAALIWEGLAAGRSEERILSDLRSEFEVSEERANDDLRGFLAELGKAGLLREV